MISVRRHTDSAHTRPAARKQKPESRRCYGTHAGVGEPGCVGVEVDVVYFDGKMGAGTSGDTDTHQRVLLLGGHHNLKDP